MKDTPDIKLCPFCGGTPVLDTLCKPRKDVQYFYRCFSCAAEGGWAKTIAGATTLWNLRTNP